MSEIEFIRITRLRPVTIRRRKRDGRWAAYGLASSGTGIAVFPTKSAALAAVKFDRALSGRMGKA